MAYRGILLDFYGTLVHEDDDIVAEICGKIFSASPRAESAKEIGSLWWDNFSQLTKSCYGTSFLPQREIARLALTKTLHHFDAELDPAPLLEHQFDNWIRPEVFPDALDFLRHLEMTGTHVCIVSNIDRTDLTQAIEHHNFQFKIIITSDDVQAYKPRQEIFSAALDSLNLEPADVLHIGDSRTSDVAGALAIHLPVAWVNRTGKQPSSDLQPDFTLQNLTEIIPHLA